MKKLQAGGVGKTNTRTQELLELLRIPHHSWNVPPSFLSFIPSVHGKLLPGPSPPKQSSPLLPTWLLYFPHPSLISLSSGSHWTTVLPQPPKASAASVVFKKENNSICYSITGHRRHSECLLPVRYYVNYSLLLKPTSKNYNRNPQWKQKKARLSERKPNSSESFVIF